MSDVERIPGFYDFVSDRIGGTHPVNPEHKFDDDLGLDSLEIIELVMDVERKYDVEIDDTAVEKLTTVSELETLILEKLKP